MKPWILNTPAIRKENGQSVHAVSVLRGDDPEELWFAVDPSFADLLSTHADASCLGLLIPAMKEGTNLTVRGPVNTWLAHNLQGPLQVMLKMIIPTLSQIDITFEDVHHTLQREDGIATGFSGGIDSFYCLKKHFFDTGLPGQTITHLLFNNVGSHGPGGKALFEERSLRLLPVAKELELPFISVDSNLQDFYPDSTSFELTNSIRNASVAHLFQAEIGRVLYSSSYGPKDVHPFEYSNMAIADPFTLPLMSSQSMAIDSCGIEHTRVEKTLELAEVRMVQRYLDVCTNAFHRGKAPNCSVCTKCLRTQLTFEIAGCLENFADRFDLNAYQQHRAGYIKSLPTATTYFEREILAFAKERGFDLHPNPHDEPDSDERAPVSGDPPRKSFSGLLKWIRKDS